MTLREIIAFALYVQDMKWEQIPSDPPFDIEYEKELWRRLQENLSEPHFGDCTGQSVSCHRCYVEEFYETADMVIKFVGGANV